MANTDVNPTSFVNKDTKLDSIKPLPDLPEDLNALNFETMTDQELQDLMQNLKDHNENLDIENELYECYYQRTNPYVMKLNKLNDTTEQSTKQEVDLDTALDEWELQKKMKKRQQTNRRDDRKKKRKDEKEEEKPMLLTVDQKLEIIGRAHDELKEKIEKKKDKWERAIDEIKVNRKNDTLFLYFFKIYIYINSIILKLQKVIGLYIYLNIIVYIKHTSFIKFIYEKLFKNL